MKYAICPKLGFECSQTHCLTKQQCRETNEGKLAFWEKPSTEFFTPSGRHHTDPKFVPSPVDALKNKPRNPKDITATHKLNASILPPVGLVHTSYVMSQGSKEYGPHNWFTEPVKRSVYDDAIERHWLKYKSGEAIDEKSGAPHLAHIAANCLLLMDAEHNEVLTEDAYYRNGKGVTSLIAHYSKPKKD